MSAIKDNDLRPMPEQITYANILFLGAWVGIFLLLITYFIYVAGIMEPLIPINEVPNWWGQGVHEWTATAGAPSGWHWVTMLDTGDYLNFIGLALLATLTVVCYLVLLPGYIKRKDWTYATICILEVLVLSLAASGIFGSGGH